MFYLQGGPGGGCPLPQDASYTKTFLDKGYNIFFLDQRGAGLSQTLTARTILARGKPQDQAAYLKHFRADSIVRDCEAVRQAVTADYPEGERKISLLGQSFGGFCATTYLSKYPAGLREVFMTGGLPPLDKQPDNVYERLVERAAARSNDYYTRFPDDVERVRRIAAYLSRNKVETPSGGSLTVERLRAAGIVLGFQSGFGRLHGLVTRVDNDLDTYGYLTRPSIRDFEDLTSQDESVLYAILHEPIYNSGNAANWSAERQLARSKHYGKASPDSQLNFTAEMIVHANFRDSAELRPLQDAAEILAADDDWPDLYDKEQLGRNEVPVFAATYFDDIYVDFERSQETARAIRGCQTFVTNRMYHDGLRSKTTQVLDELFALRDDVLE